MKINRNAVRRTGAVTAAVAVIGAGLASGSAPAQAATPPTTTAFAVAWNHVSSPKTDTGGFFAGAAVSMICWRDGDWYNGTNRWFWVTGTGLKVDGSGGNVTGFVSASYVKNQQTVGHCAFA